MKTPDLIEHSKIGRRLVEAGTEPAEVACYQFEMIRRAPAAPEARG